LAVGLVFWAKVDLEAAVIPIASTPVGYEEKISDLAISSVQDDVGRVSFRFGTFSKF